MNENKQGVETRQADLDFDNKSRLESEPEPKVKPEIDEEEQRRQFALSFAANTANEIDLLLTNARKIEDYLKGSVVDKS